MSKARNGSLEACDASKQWKLLTEAAGALTDSLCATARYSKRVAVKKADYVVFRQSQSRSHGFTVKEKEQRQATEDDLAKAEHLMQHNSVSLARNLAA